jgi:hypothetical protein
MALTDRSKGKWDLNPQSKSSTTTLFEPRE